MKGFSIIIIIIISVVCASAQNEQAPIIEKDLTYKNWTYKSITDGADVDLRQFISDKKLVMVVYFAPWCPNWRFDAPMLQRLYNKYRSQGLGVIAVGLYDPVASMKANVDALKITFPVVYESELRTDRVTSLHYQYRSIAGDKRKWGSPWYIFLKSSSVEKIGDTLVKRANIVNGELIETEGEAFIRTYLGLPEGEKTKGLSKLLSWQQRERI